jgi:hypothetical protein
MPTQTMIKTALFSIFVGAVIKKFAPLSIKKYL